MKSVFAGWSEVDCGEEALSVEPSGLEIVTGITMPDDNKTVHAVWAVDKNGNDIPDYKEEHATVTYDVNGGSGDAPAQATYVRGEEILLASGSHLTKDGAIFAGWSEEQCEDVLTADDKNEYDRIVANDPYTVENDVTLYAVYAVVENNNGVPDYGDKTEPMPEDKYTVHYNMNGGKGTVPAEYLNAEYSMGKKAKLWPAEAADVTRDGAVFLGWSAKRLDIFEYEPDEGKLITELEITGTNPVVYAVWALDFNGNGKPDYDNDSFTIHYDGNGCDEGSRLPVDITGILSGTSAKLAKAPVDGLTKAGAVQLGWSAESHDVFTEAPEAGTIINIVTVTDGDITVYAVWAIDENGNDLPDYEETKYPVTYHLNGGEGTVPEEFTGTYPEGTTITLWKPADGAAPTREKAVFLGWSADEHEIFTAAPENGVIIGTVIVNGDITVYAVWAADIDGNDIPDYEENKYAVTYDLNGGSGVVLDKFLEEHFEDEKIVLWQPDPEDAPQMDKAVFLGWSKEPHEIFTEAPADGVIVETVVSAEGVAVYAAWAIDENGDRIPDYVKTYHTVTYEWAKPTSAPTRPCFPKLRLLRTARK